MTDVLIDRIDAILPQTQCRQCTYAGCRPYAEAIARSEADIDQCPPGGAEGVRLLAALLSVALKPLNPAHGVAKPRAVAVIDEALCIGCTLCIKACPVDAIIGAARQMHTVVAFECTGCELCVAPCPVDCITIEPIEESVGSWRGTERARQARERFDFRLLRVERDKAESVQRLAAKQAVLQGATIFAGSQSKEAADTEAKRAAIAAAIERVKARKAAAKLVDASSVLRARSADQGAPTKAPTNIEPQAPRQDSSAMGDAFIP